MFSDNDPNQTQGAEENDTAWRESKQVKREGGFIGETEDVSTPKPASYFRFINDEQLKNEKAEEKITYLCVPVALSEHAARVTEIRLKNYSDNYAGFKKTAEKIMFDVEGKSDEEKTHALLLATQIVQKMSQLAKMYTELLEQSIFAFLAIGGVYLEK